MTVDLAPGLGILIAVRVRNTGFVDCRSTVGIVDQTHEEKRLKESERLHSFD